MQKSPPVVVMVLFALFAALGAAPLSPALAWEDYAPVVLRAKVVDRAGNPVVGAPVRFTADLDGVEQSPASNGSQVFHQPFRRVAVTDRTGVASAPISPPSVRAGADWFRGTARFSAEIDPTPSQDLRAFGPASVRGLQTLPLPPGESDPFPTLRVWEAPDLLAGGFPIWLGRDNRADRIVVLVEGFDLYNSYSATDTLRLVDAAGDALRQAGIDLMVVNFPDSHQAPDTLAPIVARAIRAASRAAGGRRVAVAGLSAGGITARWALVSAENESAPLPVHTVLFLDTPQRGARLSPALQALTLRYGKTADRRALGSAAARSLLTAVISDPAKDVTWRRVGPPLARRLMPVRCTPTSASHQAFYDRLRRLNDRGVYPKTCRLVAVANSSRETADTRRSAPSLMRLWLPWNSGWTLKADAADIAAGSLLPRLYVDQFRVRYPLGLAGAYLPTTPTFLPCESALDAGPGETPPFDAWYARPAGLAPLAHDEIDPGAGAFVVRELLGSAWNKNE